jgi:lipopolysaccharide transport system permease protein
MRFPTAREREYLRDLVFVLTQKEVKVRYKNSWLGYLWSIANPLAFALVYFVSFKTFMRIDIPNYTLFLIAGLFPWQWFSNSISAAPTIFVGNASLLKKIRFPRSILVAVTVLNDGIHFVISIPVIIGFMLAYGLSPSWSWLIGIPILAMAQFLLIYGIAMVVASLNLFFRDLERLTNILLLLLFFLTPIFYSESMIPPSYQAILYINPLAPLMLSWRQLFLSGDLVFSGAVTACVYGVIALGLGFLVYSRLSWKFAEVV